MGGVISDNPSAPPASAAFAISVIEVTFGESFTTSGFFECFFTALVSSFTTLGSVPNAKPPRIAETPSGILNSVGLQNPGVEHFAKHIMPILAEYDTNVIANMSGNTIEEYCEMAEIL